MAQDRSDHSETAEHTRLREKCEQLRRRMDNEQAGSANAPTLHAQLMAAEADLFAYAQSFPGKS